MSNDASSVSSLSKPKKADITRARIVDAALELFAEKGYDQTTMRLIAERAGVSVGNAYYYFPSKEALMQGYYKGLLLQFSAKAEATLQDEKDFVNRLTGVLIAWVENAETYHDFAGGFFRYAANPSSPLSPFSDESAPTRNACIALFARVVDGSEKLKMADEVREQLPELLWLYQMATVLFWVYDSSPHQEDTKMLIGRTAPLVGQLVGLSRLPVLRGAARDVVSLFTDLKNSHP